MLTDTIGFYHLVPLSVTLTLDGVTRSVQSKTPWLQFLAHFSTGKDEIWCVAEAVQVKYPDTTFERDLMEQWIELLFYWMCKKKTLEH